MPNSLHWLDISHAPADGERVALDAVASVVAAHQQAVIADADALLAWLHAHGGEPDQTGDGLARWSVDDQRGLRNGRYEVAMALDLDAELGELLHQHFELDPPDQSC